MAECLLVTSSHRGVGNRAGEAIEAGVLAWHWRPESRALGPETAQPSPLICTPPIDFRELPLPTFSQHAPPQTMPSPTDFKRAFFGEASAVGGFPTRNISVGHDVITQNEVGRLGPARGLGADTWRWLPRRRPWQGLLCPAAARQGRLRP